MCVCIYVLPVSNDLPGTYYVRRSIMKLLFWIVWMDGNTVIIHHVPSHHHTHHSNECERMVGVKNVPEKRPSMALLLCFARSGCYSAVRVLCALLLVCSFTYTDGYGCILRCIIVLGRSACKPTDRPQLYVLGVYIYIYIYKQVYSFSYIKRTRA